MSSHGEVGPAEARTRACLDRIALLDASLKVFITVCADEAIREARALDARAAAGEWTGLLHGMPVAIKDNIDTAGVRTTSGSRFFAERVPNRDAPVVARLRAAGAVIVGKATLHELAFGTRSNNPVLGQCRNPWDSERIPGGSSGGSGAAVAAGMCEAALGSDTGGSIRLPSAICGVAGLRPTVGRVPNRGSTPVAASQDTIGPMARRVADVARVFAVIAGPDEEDATSVDRPLGNFLPRLDGGIAGVAIGVPRNYYFDDVDPEIGTAVEAAMGVLEGAGARLVDVNVPGAEDMHHFGSVIIYSDACAVHAERIESAPERFDPQVLARMRTGLDFTSVDYAAAMRARERWRHTLARLYAEVDVLLSPCVPVATPPIADERSLLEAARDLSRNTFAGAFAQMPGLSVPCGFRSDGLPIGLQLEAAWWEEPLLLRVGHAYQQATEWHRAHPPGIAEP